MADNGKLQFFGQTVYPQTTVSNILNDDGTQWTPPPEVPAPTTADNGKVLGVTNGAYALQEASGGGGGVYLHSMRYEDTSCRVSFYLNTSSKTPITSWSYFASYPNVNVFGFYYNKVSSKYFPILSVSAAGDTGLSFGVFDPTQSSNYENYDVGYITITDTVTPL